MLHQLHFHHSHNRNHCLCHHNIPVRWGEYTDPSHCSRRRYPRIQPEQNMHKCYMKGYHIHHYRCHNTRLWHRLHNHHQGRCSHCLFHRNTLWHPDKLSRRYHRSPSRYQHNPWVVNKQPYIQLDHHNCLDRCRQTRVVHPRHCHPLSRCSRCPARRNTLEHPDKHCRNYHRSQDRLQHSRRVDSIPKQTQPDSHIHPSHCHNTR
ncbi:hypothetical protein DSECCO2_551350 [anaerobic digester metagenome]